MFLQRENPSTDSEKGGPGLPSDTLKSMKHFLEWLHFLTNCGSKWLMGFGSVLLCEDFEFETTHCHIYFNISSWEEMAKLNFEIILRSSDQPSGEVFCLKESKKSKKWVHINGMHLWQLGASALIQWVVMCTLKNYLVIMTLGFIIPLCLNWPCEIRKKGLVRAYLCFKLYFQF